MRIDIAFEKGGYPPRVMAELGALAERYGIGTVWASNDPGSRDPFVNLADMARATRRIRLGVTAISPFEMHPVKIANALLTLNEVADGRASILVGGGGAIIGTIMAKPTRRVRAVKECIEILKRASASAPLTYKGEIYSIRNYRPEWAVQTPPRILAAANRPQMLRMAARVADGMMMSDMPLPLVEGIVATVREELKNCGRSDLPFEINNYWAWHVKEDRAVAVAEARNRLFLRGMLGDTYIAPFLSEADRRLVASCLSSFYKAFYSRSSQIEGVPDRIVDALVDGLTSTGDLKDLDREIDRLKQFEALGLTHIALGLHDDPAAAIRIIGERVVPAFA